jgi:hypothetical protein
MGVATDNVAAAFRNFPRQAALDVVLHLAPHFKDISVTYR